MSTFTSSNGTKFNFKLDNGLPYKPILETTFKLFSQKNNKNAGIIQIFLESNDLNNSLDSIVFESFSIDDKEAYLDIGKFYIYILNIIMSFFINQHKIKHYLLSCIVMKNFYLVLILHDKF